MFMVFCIDGYRAVLRKYPAAFLWILTSATGMYLLSWEIAAGALNAGKFKKSHFSLQIAQF